MRKRLILIIIIGCAGLLFLCVAVAWLFFNKPMLTALIFAVSLIVIGGLGIYNWYRRQNLETKTETPMGSLSEVPDGIVIQAQPFSEQPVKPVVVALPLENPAPQVAQSSLITSQMMPPPLPKIQSEDTAQEIPSLLQPPQVAPPPLPPVKPTSVAPVYAASSPSLIIPPPLPVSQSSPSLFTISPVSSTVLPPPVSQISPPPLPVANFTELIPVDSAIVPPPLPLSQTSPPPLPAAPSSISAVDPKPAFVSEKAPMTVASKPKSRLEVKKMFDQVKDTASWKKLLSYYIDCLTEESRLQYVISNIQKTCRFLPDIVGNLLNGNEKVLVPLPKDEKERVRWRYFILGEPNKRVPNVCFGYPFFVSTNEKLMPLLYVDILGREVDTGFELTRNSEVEINFAALWEILPGDKEISLDEVFTRFEAIEVQPGESRFELTLNSLLSYLEELSGKPIRRVPKADFNPQNLPSYSYTVIECPLLFHVSNVYTGQLLRELNWLKSALELDKVPLALRHLLDVSNGHPYPDTPELATDSRLYITPANDSQRKAVLAAEQCPLTVVTGPPGTGKSQLILNIVGDALFRGETVLIASKNNQAVKVIYDRLCEFGYPGIIRSGNKEMRVKIPSAMSKAFTSVRAGNIASHLEKVREEYTEILREIDEQRKTIHLVEKLEHDRQVYELEERDLLGRLAESTRMSVEKEQIQIEFEEGVRLNAALRNLHEAIQEIVAQKNILSQKTKGVFIENRENMAFLTEIEKAERQLSSISLRYASVDLETFSAMKSYIEQWYCLLEVLPIEHEIQPSRDTVGQLHSQLEVLCQELSPELVTILEYAPEMLNLQQEQVLRESLGVMQDEIKQMADHCSQFLNQIADLCKQYPVMHSWLGKFFHIPVADTTVLDFRFTGAGFSIEDSVLEAHRLVHRKKRSPNFLTNRPNA